MRKHSSFLRRSLAAVAATAMVLALAVVTPLVVTHRRPRGSDGGHRRRQHHPARAERPIGQLRAPASCTQGDAVTNYHWLINQDDTGDPGTVAEPGHQQLPAGDRAGRQHRPGLRRHLPVALGPQHLRASHRSSPRATRADLSDGTALTDLPAGKYLISVTADDFKIDGKHFTVTAGGTTQRSSSR